MEEKFKQGLANQVMEEFEHIKNLRIEFIACKSDNGYVECFEDIMNMLLSKYLEITK